MLPHIPPELLSAVTALGGARLAIVIGAGCSCEPPTQMPLARQLSTEAHRKLVHEGVLNAGECADPTDLAGLATLVFQKTGSQAALIRQFPVDRMRMARANEGYRMLIALMLEGAVSHVLSLNFDLAPQNAAVELGEAVTIVDRSNTLIPMTKTVVHIHGSVNSADDDWVLRTEVINNDWKSRWQEVVARQILAAPNVLFVGLGSAAPVLSETVTMIAAAVGQQKAFYQADVGEHAHSDFAQQLNVTEDRYIRGSWCEVMSLLAAHLAEEQSHTLATNGEAILKENGASDEELTAFREIANRLRGITLLALGRFRANAQLNVISRYLPRTQQDEEWTALPLKALAGISAETGLVAVPAPPGMWHLKSGGRIRAHVLIVTGRGTRKMSALETSIRSLSRAITEEIGMGPDIVLVGSVIPDVPPESVSAPSDIVDGEESVADIITGPGSPRVLSVDSGTVIEDAKEWLNAI
jgi:hypothetical protein